MSIIEPERLETNLSGKDQWQAPTELSGISNYYDQSEIDYQLWSREGYRHFGYWRLGIWPWQRRRMLEEMNEVVFAQLGLENKVSARLGDLGCGTGAVSEYGCRTRPNFEWHAITISNEQAQQAKTKLAKARAETKVVGHDSAHHGDYHQLPWDNDFFDAIFYFESLCHSPDPIAALQEACRTLKPGGRLVIADGFLNHPLGATSKWFQWLHRQVAENWAVPAFHEIAAVPKWLEATGLEEHCRREMGWRMAVCASHSIPLSLKHAVTMAFRTKVTMWQKKHLQASAAAMMLGMQRRNFGYYLVTLRKP